MTSKKYKNIIFYIITFLFFSFLINCCTSKSNFKISEVELQNIQNEIIHPVKIIPKSDSYSCATTSVAMAISYFNNDDKLLNKDTVWEISGSSIKIATQKGFELNGLQKIADYYKYESKFIENMSFKEMEYLLSKGALVVIFIRLDASTLHAVLVNGFNIQKRILYICDSSENIEKLSYEYLTNHWKAEFADLHKKTIKSGFVIFPKNIASIF